MRESREEAIAAAAYSLLEQHGFAGATMQAIAREARASMETFYRWYGDKTGLFRALIARNAAEVAAALDAPATGQTALACLEKGGPVLLAMLLGERAVALNRAAAADSTGTLGRALADGGRGEVRPRICALIAQAIDEGNLTGTDAETLTDLWLTLLIGDLQIRRVTGALPPLTPDAITQRAATAMNCLLRLHGTAAQRP